MSLKRVFNTIRFLYFLFFFSFLLSGCAGSLPEKARVSWVVDGDTIVLEGGERVRLLGIDTPELKDSQPWAKEAWNFTKDQLLGKYVRLEYDQVKRDRYRRLLAFVWVKGRMINEELVEQGLAYVYYIFPNERYARRLIQAQYKARNKRRGLWQYPGIISSSDLRQWKDYTRAVVGKVCRIFSTGKGIYLIFDCNPDNWAGFYLPYTRFVGVDLTRYQELVGKSVLGIGKVRCSRSNCRVLILDRYQLEVLE